MGCHTWFYKRIDSPSFEEMKEAVLKKYKESIENCEKWLSNPDSDDYKSILEAYPEWNSNELRKWMSVDLRKIKMIEGGYCRQAVVNKYCMFNPDIMIEHEGNFYVDVDDFHDVFRKYGYPDDRLFSLQETISYINNPDNECTIYDFTREKLVDFWSLYPDGMIDFG